MVISVDVSTDVVFCVGDRVKERVLVVALLLVVPCWTNNPFLKIATDIE